MSNPVPVLASARLDYKHLRTHTEVGSGGQGHVYDLAGGDDPLLFKQYRPEANADADALIQLVDFYRTADPEWKAWLDEHTAWPLTVVHHHDVVSGFLMRRAPERFYVTLRVGYAGQKRPLTLAHLLNPTPYLSRVGVLVAEVERLLILRDLARTLARLHGEGVAVGDLSPNNILVDPRREPRCLLIDCDAVVLRGTSALPQTETIDWQLPAGEPMGTPAGDRYKFALTAIRVIASDQDSVDLTTLDRRFPGLAGAARQTLSAPPAERLPLEDWIDLLDQAVPHAGTEPPTVPAIAEPAPRRRGRLSPVIARADRRRPMPWTAVILAVELLLLLLLLR